MLESKVNRSLPTAGVEQRLEQAQGALREVRTVPGKRLAIGIEVNGRSEATEQVGLAGAGIDGAVVEDEGGAGGHRQLWTVRCIQQNSRHGRKGLLCGAGWGRDKMVSLVWESCLFPNPSLSLSFIH